MNCELNRLFYVNRSTYDAWHWIFVFFYATVTLSGLVTNISLLVVIRYYNRKRKTKDNQLLRQNLLIRPVRPSELTRDLLISYLATMDIFLSLTMPLTAVDGLSKYWPLGHNTETICKLTKSSPSVLVYSASMFIVLIAVNCYRQISLPHKRQVSPENVKYITLVIAILAICMSIPQLYHTKLFRLIDYDTDNNMNTTKSTLIVHSTSEITTTQTPPNESTSLIIDYNESYVESKDIYNKREFERCQKYDKINWSHVVYCIEDWPFGEEKFSPNSRLLYSSFAFSVQLLLPFIMISFCYLSIFYKLKKQSTARKKLINFNNGAKLRKENRRFKKRNKHMAVISLVYVTSWFPLGLINVLLDAYPDILGKNIANVTAVFLCCHLVGMTSTTINPIIYGYANKHIRKGNHLDIIKSLKNTERI